MTQNRRFLDDQSTIDAKFQAQRLAFGPMTFQAARALRDLGILALLKEHGTDGTTEDEIVAQTGLSIHGVRVLLEAGLAGGMLAMDDGAWVLTKVGYLVLLDPMTRANMDFVHDVCYRPMFHLDASIREQRPVGLEEHGPWRTIYEGLDELPEHVRRSWLVFDHFYSDGVFERLLPVVFADGPRRILDVGGNTGKWALCCCAHDPAVEVTVVDLPGRVEEALAAAERAGVRDRVHGVACDLLDPSASLPAGHDVIWMSQFLDCFAEDEIVTILERAAAVMTPATKLYVLEPFWDLQRHEASRFSVIQTSLYFAAVANGNSKMYHSKRMLHCIERAGLRIDSTVENVGVSHTLLCCTLAPPVGDARA